MSWSEEVAFILLQILQDPEIIRYLLSVSKPIHNNCISEESRLFHESLRMTREQRWARTRELSKQRKFHEMNNLVPITCSLPFNNVEWRTSCDLLQSIRYFIPGFIRKKYPVREEGGSLICEDVDLELPLKIKCVNLIFDDNSEGDDFRGYFTRGGIREHLDDFEYAPIILKILNKSFIPYIIENCEPENLKKIYEFLKEYKELFDIEDSILRSFEKKINMVTILINPSIYDILESNVFLLTYKGYTLTVPMLHTELY